MITPCKHTISGLLVSFLILLGISNIGTHIGSVSLPATSFPIENAEIQTALPVFPPPTQIVELTPTGSEPYSTRNHSHDFSIYSQNKKEQLSYTVIRYIQQTKHLKLGLPISDIIFPFQYFW